MKKWAFCLAALQLAMIVGFTSVGNADPLVVNNPFLQLYNVGINSDGFTSGELIRFGATSVMPNGDYGTTGYATTTNTSTNALVSRTINFNPGPADPNFFSRNIAYSPNLLGPWTINFVNGTDTYQSMFSFPNGVQEVPFVNSITLTGTAANPTFSWTPPPGTTVNGYRVNIYDRSLINLNSANGPINNGEVTSRNLQPTNTSYTVQASDFTVPGYQFTQGKSYSIEISLLQTRDGASTNLGNSNVYALSRVYADFTPLSGGSPAVNLPVVNINGSYQYNLAVQQNQTYYLDPSVAVGYIFAKNTGDPNFASVTLPAVQSSPYHISFFYNGALVDQSLLANVEFMFPGGGVSEFTITGIDPADGLDPANTTAFITGVTFAGLGSFTGTQTPIVAEAAVPEPSTLLLLWSGLAGLVGFGKRFRRA